MGYLREAYKISERRACDVVKIGRSSQRYQSRKKAQEGPRMRLKDLAAARVRYGYRRLHLLLRREGMAVNVKRVYRLYREEGLSMRTKRPRRHVSSVSRQERKGAQAPNQQWSMDFVSDQLSNGG